MLTVCSLSLDIRLSLSEPLADMSPAKSPISRRIREVYIRTWRDFHAVKPPSNRPLDDAELLNSAESSSDVMLQSFEDYQKRCAQLANPQPLPKYQGGSVVVQPSSSSQPKTVFKASILSSKPTFIDSASIARDAGVLESGVNPLPQYTFCVSLKESWIKAEEKTLPFHPTLGDDEINFRGDEYEKLFKYRYSWLQPGQDSNGESHENKEEPSSTYAVDIIIVETLKRLVAEGIDDAAIDASRVLPIKCAQIKDFEIERDLPPFPPSAQRLPEQGWSVPLLVDVDEEVRGRLDVEELWCPHAQCQICGCTAHSKAPQIPHA